MHQHELDEEPRIVGRLVQQSGPDLHQRVAHGRDLPGLLPQRPKSVEIVFQLLGLRGRRLGTTPPRLSESGGGFQSGNNSYRGLSRMPSFSFARRRVVS